MSVVFADTFYYLALHNPNDEAHRRAAAFPETFRGTLVTTWGVLLEIADGLSRPANRGTAVDVLDAIRADPATHVVPLDDRFLDRGLQLYRSRPDKGWSLTDCVSFEVMAELEVTDALTGDGHFAQAGFRPLLTPGATP